MSDTPLTPTSTRWKKAARALLIVLLGLALLVAALDRWTLSQVRSAAEGDSFGPVSFDSFAPEPLPDGMANGSDYEEAAALVVEGQHLVYSPRSGEADPGLQEIHERLRRLAGDRRPPSSEDLDFFRQEVERLSLALAILDEGLSKTHRARYATEWGGIPFDIVIPNLLVRLRFAALLHARGEIALADGRIADAWSDAARIQRLAHWSLDSLPTLINALVARAMAHQGMLLTERLLSAAPSDPEWRQKVLKEATRVEPASHYGTILGGERSATFSTLVHPDADFETLREFSATGKSSRWAPLQESLLRSKIWRRLNAMRYLDWATEFFEQCRKPSFEQDDLSRLFDDTVPSASLWGLAHRGAFNCLSVSQKRDLHIASRHHLEIALALEAVRERDGRYPEALSDRLAQKIDPFSGKSYSYARQPDGGYRLWSVSLNLEDDGGTLPSVDDRGFATFENSDLVWWVRGRVAE